MNGLALSVISTATSVISTLGRGKRFAITVGNVGPVFYKYLVFSLIPYRLAPVLLKVQSSHACPDSMIALQSSHACPDSMIAFDL